MQIEKIALMGREFALVPMEHLQKLIDQAEMLAAVKSYDAAKRRLKRGEDELIPFDIVERRVAGESPIGIWREYRGLTQEGLAKASKVSRPMIAAIETGNKRAASTR